MFFKILIIYLICASFILFESKANEIENTSNQGCSDDEFTCSDGSCINIVNRCNQIYDCPLGEDEKDCKGTANLTKNAYIQGCNEREFTCNDGSCINIEFKCDKMNDCPQSEDEDEENCNEQCSGFQCDNGGCISSEKRCDGISDCSNGEDEEFCN